MGGTGPPTATKHHRRSGRGFLEQQLTYRRGDKVVSEYVRCLGLCPEHLPKGELTPWVASATAFPLGPGQSSTPAASPWISSFGDHRPDLGRDSDLSYPSPGRTLTTLAINQVLDSTSATSLEFWTPTTDLPLLVGVPTDDFSRTRSSRPSTVSATRTWRLHMSSTIPRRPRRNLVTSSGSAIRSRRGRSRSSPMTSPTSSLSASLVRSGNRVGTPTFRPEFWATGSLAVSGVVEHIRSTSALCAESLWVTPALMGSGATSVPSPASDTSSPAVGAWEPSTLFPPDPTPVRRAVIVTSPAAAAAASRTPSHPSVDGPTHCARLPSTARAPPSAASRATRAFGSRRCPPQDVDELTPVRAHSRDQVQSIPLPIPQLRARPAGA